MTFHGLCEHLKLITKNELACYTELELLYLMIDRVNEVIESLNTLNSNVNESVKNYLIEIKQNGELEELINEALFEALDHKIDLMGNVPVDDDLQNYLIPLMLLTFLQKLIPLQNHLLLDAVSLSKVITVKSLLILQNGKVPTIQLLKLKLMTLLQTLIM